MPSIKVGAAWWKQDRNGQDYLSISFDPACPVIINPGQRAALFPNPNKTQQNQPDYELVILPTRQADMEADEFSPEQAPRNTYAQQAPPPAQRRAAAPPPEDFADAPPARPLAPRSAAPAPRPPAAPPPTRAAAPARAAATRPARQPAPPPDYDADLSDLDDPFAE